MTGKERGLGDAVDWSFAAGVGVRLARSEPAMSQYTRDAVHEELFSAAARAEGPVREHTRLDDGTAPAPARVVDRPGWVRAAAASMADLTTAADSDRSGGPRWTGKPAGAQAGAMLAYLSSAVLGQYDPFSRSLLLVAPNVVAVERALKVPPADFRLWVCLHEVTHRVQFAQAPWMADLMRDAATELATAVEEPVGEVATRVVSAVKDLRTPGDKPMSERGMLGIVRALQAQSQRESFDRILALGTLLEGHADHVMDGVGPAVVPSVARIRRAFDARRHRNSSPVHRLIRLVLGMDAKMAQYVHGKKFVDAVVAEAGMDAFNTVWSGADALPTLAEIDDPGRWIARVLS